VSRHDVRDVGPTGDAPAVEAASAAGIAFESADVGYGDDSVVSGVDLSVGRGEFVGLVGPNGAGKSTLLRALTGTARVLGGRVLLAGQDTRTLAARYRARILGVVPQTLPEPFAFSAEEFVQMGRYPHLGRMQQFSDADGAVVGEVMDVTDTARLAGDRVDRMSGGDLQRLTLAQALAQQPTVLLLDEPVSHLDLNHRLQILELVRGLVDAGMAVLAVFHELELAARYSDRLAIVSSGGVPLVGKPADVLTPSTLREVFAVRAVIGTDPVTGTVAVTPVLREQVAIATSGPTVLVIGGSGAASRLMHDLALAGFRLHAGALNRGDVDYSVAEALGADVVELPAFGEVDAVAEERVAAAAGEADICVVAGVPFGRANLGNLRALEASDAPKVLVGSMTSERDFTHGEAAAVWETLVARGAIQVGSDEEALVKVECLGP